MTGISGPEAVDVAMIENSFATNPLMTNGMPSHLDIRVKLGQKGKFIALSLDRNPVFDDTRNIYVLYTKPDGSQDLIKQNIPIKKVGFLLNRIYRLKR